MSQENVDTVKRSNAALNSGDYDGALDAFHDDVEWRDIMHAPDVPKSVRGVSAVRALLRQWLTAFDEFTMEIEGTSMPGFRRLRDPLARKGHGQRIGDRHARGGGVRVRRATNRSLHAGLPRQGRSSQNRWAVGVGDVAEQRGDRRASGRCVQPA